jgi:hypothetical protein
MNNRNATIIIGLTPTDKAIRKDPTVPPINPAIHCKVSQIAINPTSKLNLLIEVDVFFNNERTNKDINPKTVIK